MSSPEPTDSAPRLRLQAIDAEDLSVVSAHLQDALLRVGDLAYLPRKRRFALIASRFDWSAQAVGRLERCRTALHFESVLGVRYTGVARDRPDGVLELLAISFEPGKTSPEGQIRLIFAAGAVILLDVDCIEAQLCDLGPRWAVSCCPTHKLDEGAGAGS